MYCKNEHYWCERAIGGDWTLVTVDDIDTICKTASESIAYDWSCDEASVSGTVALADTETAFFNGWYQGTMMVSAFILFVMFFWIGQWIYRK